MIDLVQYRFRIGTYKGMGARGNGRINSTGEFLDSSVFNPYNRSESIIFYTADTKSGRWTANILQSSIRHIHLSFLALIYIYIMSLLTSCMLSKLVSSCCSKSDLIVNTIGVYVNLKLSLICLTHIKIGYFCLLSSIILKSYSLSKAKSKLIIPRIGASRLCRILSQSLLFLLLLNFLLIGIVNPSLLNPGPNSLKICYQNVQGLIPIKDLTLKQPSLNVTKIYELNSYININNPDIIMLNETWLRKCVDDHEVIKDKNFTIYRNDRTQVSHPSDPNNPNKFRKLGGGVLIAIRSNIQADIKRLSVRKGAEIVAIEVTIDNKKFVFCTVYRVGNLDEPNHASIINTIKTFYTVRNPRKIFILGDFNLRCISWPLSDESELSSGTEKLFADSFQVFDIDLDQNKVRKLLLNINSNKASGPDGIHGKILKNCANTLAYPLSLLFKISYNTGSLPKEWKIANVVPIHKKGSKDDIKNYRPISLTSLVMKTFERILKDELLIRTSHLLDCRQHGFLNFKSCTTNLVNFTDKLVMSINDTQTLSTDVIYFDFSKAFDSVNHDLILHKLKYEYAIDGSLLKFLMNYLGEREQSVVLDGIKSSSKPVLSGVPQGSILGPILFVLFINDLPQGISEDTHLALYADDTKIWRSIRNEEDIVQLQTDINNLHMWSINNKMMFHPDKCKVVTIKHKPSPLAMLPFVAYHYHLAENILSYADSERDLGVHVNKSFNFNEHCEKLLIKANQQFGILKRTCHFVTDKNRRRVLYLALVRSQFEHCSPIWRPCGNTMINKFENFQKKCIKWILSELELSYSNEVYLRKCKQVNILPLLYRFMFNDMNLFHKVVYKIIPVTMPDYLRLYSGDSRLRSTHLDNLSFVSNIASTTTSISNLNKSFFFRSHTLWNFLPFDLRNSMIPSQFKIKLAKHYWNMASTDIEQPEDGWSFQSSDVGD